MIPSSPKTFDLTQFSYLFFHYRRSTRSGYAFAHTEGFGRLITSGRMMRQQNQVFQVNKQTINDIQFDRKILKEFKPPKKIPRTYFPFSERNIVIFMESIPKQNPIFYGIESLIK